MLIFDEAGCHRGSKLLFSDRYVLRFLFREFKLTIIELFGLPDPEKAIFTKVLLKPINLNYLMKKN